jgi:hypothetical protein
MTGQIPDVAPGNDRRKRCHRQAQSAPRGLQLPRSGPDGQPNESSQLGRAAACRFSPQAAPRAGQHTQLPWGGPGHGGHRPLAAPLVRVWPPAATPTAPKPRGHPLASLVLPRHEFLRRDGPAISRDIATGFLRERRSAVDAWLRSSLECDARALAGEPLGR